MDTFVAGNDMQMGASQAAATIVDFTDLVGLVSLITVPFNDTPDIDPATIPPNSTNFTRLESSDVPIRQWTPATGGWSLVWPDPEGGWDFVSGTITEPITVYGYRVDALADANFIGCRKFSAGVPITANGQHIYLGEISLPMNGKVFS